MAGPFALPHLAAVSWFRAPPPEPACQNRKKGEAGGACCWPQTFSQTFSRGAVVLTVVGAVVLLALGEDPRVDHVNHLGDQRQVVAAEARRVLPLIAVLVE